MVERDTGIGRDTLRVWERRYGFPRPVRNAKGERSYPEDPLRRLQRPRRLLDRGMRPGKLLPSARTSWMNSKPVCCLKAQSSGAYSYQNSRPHLNELRELIADDIALKGF